MMRQHGLCGSQGHEWVGDEYTPDDTDLASFRVTVTGPSEPARVNAPEELCGSCAGTVASAYAGWGWSSAIDFIDGTSYEESCATARDFWRNNEQEDE